MITVNKFILCVLYQCIFDLLFFFFVSVYGCSNVFLPILNEMCGYLVGFGVKKKN